MSVHTVEGLIGMGELPGHYIRRLQQIAVAVFLAEVEGFDITPVQYAALRGICQSPGTDQRTLAASSGLDTSTIAGVVDRLESRGWVVRQTSREDRRVRLLEPTSTGLQLLKDLEPAVRRAQARILAPLNMTEQTELMRLLQILITENNDLSRAPAE